MATRVFGGIKFFQEILKTDGRTHNGQQAMTLTRWPMASGAKNVFIHNKQVQSVNHIWSLIFYQMTNSLFVQIKAPANDKFLVAQTLRFIFDRAENIEGKQKSSVTSILLSAHNVFRSQAHQKS